MTLLPVGNVGSVKCGFVYKQQSKLSGSFNFYTGFFYLNIFKAKEAYTCNQGCINHFKVTEISYGYLSPNGHGTNVYLVSTSAGCY